MKILEFLEQNINQLAVFWRRHQSRKKLENMNSCFLKELMDDTGISGTDIFQEIKKPFWKE